MTVRGRSIVVAAWIAASTIGCDKPASKPAEAGEAAEPVPVEPVRDTTREEADNDYKMRTARAKKHTERVLRELDADKDGVLTIEEATATRGDAPAVFADFAAIDFDRDGKLSADEITASLAGRRRPVGAP
jgi:hypothetical protein